MSEHIVCAYDSQSIKMRHPHYRDSIDRGDFKIYLNPRGCVVVEWTNTAILSPSFRELTAIVEREFSVEEQPTLRFNAGFMSLMIVSDIPRDILKNEVAELKKPRILYCLLPAYIEPSGKQE